MTAVILAQICRFKPACTLAAVSCLSLQSLTAVCVLAKLYSRTPRFDCLAVAPLYQNGIVWAAVACLPCVTADMSGLLLLPGSPATQHHP